MDPDLRLQIALSGASRKQSDHLIYPVAIGPRILYTPIPYTQSIAFLNHAYKNRLRLLS
jgi:hypothetical protein